MQELYGTRMAEIIPRFAMIDPYLKELAALIESTLLEDPLSNDFYIETISQMVAVRLLAAHSTLSPAYNSSAKNNGQHWKMKRVLDFIECNLDQDLSLEKLAGIAEVSPLYFPRTFRRALGQSAHQYVIERRLERAKELLRDTDMPIGEIAMRTGFSTQSHLAKWFMRSVGVLPASYRRPSSQGIICVAVGITEGRMVTSN